MSLESSPFHERPQAVCESWGCQANLNAFTQVTDEFFDIAEYSLETDPDSGLQYYAATVTVSGTAQQIDALRKQWHFRIMEELPDCMGRFVLDVRHEP